jgi:hypothetical protein
MSFTYLCRALRRAGQTVHVNDYALARRNPEYPVGICGYPHILDNWSLPNPAVLGPGLYDHPKLNPELMNDPRFRTYLVRCDWMRDMFATVYDADLLEFWFAGIDLANWPDTKNRTKDVDVLVYDKIRWNRDRLVPGFLQPMLSELSRRNLRFEVLEYTRYTQAEYVKLLGRSRSMLFLCESETQGRAYQEAMASNVPILAWVPGFWLDPNRARWEAHPVKATSVPYFSELCGERFSGLEEFAPVLDRFWTNLKHYSPRGYVEKELSLSESARVYLSAYVAAAAPSKARAITAARDIESAGAQTG